MNKIQKIFLPKYKYNILEFIEQNADKINFKYYPNVMASEFDYEYIIEAPQIYLRALNQEYIFTQTKSFNFVQYDPMGRVLCSKIESSTKFAKRVYLKLKMFYAYKKLQNQKPSKDK